MVASSWNWLWPHIVRYYECALRYSFFFMFFLSPLPTSTVFTSLIVLRTTFPLFVCFLLSFTLAVPSIRPSVRPFLSLSLSWADRLGTGLVCQLGGLCRFSTPFPRRGSARSMWSIYLVMLSYIKHSCSPVFSSFPSTLPKCTLLRSLGLNRRLRP